jgi:hypothetical protein
MGVLNLDKWPGYNIAFDKRGARVSSLVRCDSCETVHASLSALK